MGWAFLFKRLILMTCAMTSIIMSAALKVDIPQGRWFILSTYDSDRVFSVGHFSDYLTSSGSIHRFLPDKKNEEIE